MTNELIHINNAETGEVITRELTDPEQKIRDAEKAEMLAEKEQKELEATQLRQTKISAYEKLGLTEAEIEALLPSPAPLVS